MEQEEFYKNFIDYNDTQVLDVPASLSDFVKYRAYKARKVRPVSIIFSVIWHCAITSMCIGIYEA